ncbi:MAG: hypothetical protein WB383_04425 [Acidimicrobiales bacterium]
MSKLVVIRLFAAVALLFAATSAMLAAGFASPAGASTSQNVVVLSVTATPSTLPDSGGVTTVTARLENANTCQLEPSSWSNPPQRTPTIYNFNGTGDSPGYGTRVVTFSDSVRPCSTSFTIPVRFTANQVGIRATVTLTLEARNSYKSDGENETSWQTKSFSVVVLPQPPASVVEATGPGNLLCLPHVTGTTVGQGFVAHFVVSGPVGTSVVEISYGDMAVPGWNGHNPVNDWLMRSLTNQRSSSIVITSHLNMGPTSSVELMVGGKNFTFVVHCPNS